MRINYNSQARFLAASIRSAEKAIDDERRGIARVILRRALELIGMLKDEK